MDNHLLEMVIIIRLLCVSTGAIPEKLALRELIDWLQTKGSLYSRQDIIRLYRFSVETRPNLIQLRKGDMKDRYYIAHVSVKVPSTLKLSSSYSDD